MEQEAKSREKAAFGQGGHTLLQLLKMEELEIAEAREIAMEVRRRKKKKAWRRKRM